MIVLELNDVGLRALGADRELAASPGVISAQRREAVFGEAALARLKLAPVETEHEFWQRFGREPLRRRNPLGRQQADLAYLHLEQLWSEAGASGDTVIAAVPGDFRSEQLALFLGMARRLGIPVRAVTDLALASSSRPEPGRRLLHLDIHLHRVVLTALRQGQELLVEQAWSSPDTGLLRLLDAWAHATARVFVQNTRFDPMDEAAVEQQLFDQLWAWVRSSEPSAALPVRLEHAGRRFEAQLAPQAVLDAAAPLYRRLRQFLEEALDGPGPATLQLSHRMARLPGLVEALSLIPELRTMQLQPDALLAGAADTPLAPPEAGEVPLVRARPWLGEDQARSHGQSLRGYTRRPATHWLVSGLARPLPGTLALDASGARIAGEAGAGAAVRLEHRDGELRLGEVGDPELLLNGRTAASGQTLAAGDRLRIERSGLDVTLVSVLDDGR